MKKHPYEVPEAEILYVKFEENILSEYSTENSSLEQGSVNDMSNPQQSIWHWEQ